MWINADVRMFTLLKSEWSLRVDEALDSVINFGDHWFEAKLSQPKTQKSF